MGGWNVTLFYILILTTIATIFGTLKQIFVVKYDGFWKYVFTTIDQLFYIFTVGIIVNDLKNAWYVVAFVVGKNIGVFLADVVSSRLMRKVYLVTLFTTNHTEEIEGYLLEKELSYNLVKSTSKHRKTHDMFKIHLPSKIRKKFFKDIKNILGKEPVCDITEVSVTGKLKEKIDLV